MAGFFTFSAAMVAFVCRSDFPYDRSVDSGIYEVPGAPEEANGGDQHVARPA